MIRLYNFLRLLSVSKFNFCFLLSFNSIYSTISSLTIIILDGMKGSKIIEYFYFFSLINQYYTICFNI